MVTIRPAEKRDAEAIFGLARQFPIPVFPRSQRIFNKFLADANTFFIVANASEQIVGYLLGIHRYGLADVQEIMVAQDFRNKGIGKLFMESFENWARGKKCRNIIIGGVLASGFYQALGYKQSAILFRKSLSKSAA
jgi:GNAT superfamily N-acetyltransferase